MHPGDSRRNLDRDVDLVLHVACIFPQTLALDLFAGWSTGSAALLENIRVSNRGTFQSSNLSKAAAASKPMIQPKSGDWKDWPSQIPQLWPWFAVLADRHQH